MLLPKLTKVKLTSFQWQVLRATLTIPFGETRSYAWIARQIGNPQAVRAVGQALRCNPYPLLMSCHRVVKEDGTSGGYAGVADSARKKKLLTLESELAGEMSRGSGKKPKGA